MAAILNHPATMSTSYLHLLTGGMQQYGAGGADFLDDWDQQLDPTSFLQDDVANHDDQAAEVEFGDYMCFDDDDEAQAVAAAGAGLNLQAARLDGSSWDAVTEADSAGALVAGGNGGHGSKRIKKEDGSAAAAARYRKRIGFRTKSEVDVLDDGYKWRKYGKKSVKNSPNPRNYYKCSCQGCNVKKRVERDSQDSNYVLTIYEGVHNHASISSAASFVRYTFDNNNTQLCGNSAAAGSTSSSSPWLSSPAGRPGTAGWASPGSNGWAHMNSSDAGQFSFC